MFMQYAITMNAMVAPPFTFFSYRKLAQSRDDDAAAMPVAAHTGRAMSSSPCTPPHTAMRFSDEVEQHGRSGCAMAFRGVMASFRGRAADIT